MNKLRLSLVILLIISHLNIAVNAAPHMYLGKSSVALVEQVDSTPYRLSEDSRLYEYFGLGYDMFLGNPLGETVDEGFRPRLVFALTYDQNIRTADNLFIAPDQVTVINDMSCSFSSSSASYTGMSSYQKDLSVSVSMKFKRKGGGVKMAFAASAEYKQMKSAVEQQNKVSVVTQAKCLLYRASLMESAVLSDDFKASVAQAYKKSDFTGFINDWGTHFAHQVTFGAQAIQRSFYERKDVQEMESMGINVAASASVSGYGAKASLKAKMGYSQEQEDKFSSAKSEVRESYMGLAPPENGDTRTWLANIKNSNPVPVGFKLTEISELLSLRYFNGTYTQADLNTMKSLIDGAINLKSIQMDFANDADDELGSLDQSVQPLAYKTFDGDAPEWIGVAAPSENRAKIIVTDITIYHTSTKLYHITMALKDLTTGTTYRNNPNNFVIPSGHTQSTFTIPNGTSLKYITAYATTSSPFYIAGVDFCLDNGICSYHYGGYTSKEDRIDIPGNIIFFEDNSGCSSGNTLEYVAQLKFRFFVSKYNTITGFKQLKTNKIGADLGEYFEDPDRPILDIKTKKVIIWSDAANIYGLRLNLTMGSTEFSTDLMGRVAGTKYEFLFNSTDDTYFTTVSLWARDYVNGIEFATKKKATRYGNCDGTPSAIYTLNGFITGFYGYDGSTIKSLGIKYLSAL